MAQLSDVATWLARRGYAIYPTAELSNVPVGNCGSCRGGECDGEVCACLQAVDPCHGVRSASSDLDLTAMRWEEHPDRNVGIHAGRSGLVVLDLDNHGHTQPAELAPGMPMPDGVDSGVSAYRALLAEHGQTWPDDTLVVATPTGGRHIYYQAPQAELRACQAGWQIDVRAGDAGVVAPGSVRKFDSGERAEYRRVSEAIEPAPFPRWLGQHLVDRGIVPDPTQRQARAEQQQRSVGGGSHRRGWWERARAGCLDDIAHAEAGRRNEIARSRGYRLMALAQRRDCPWTAEEIEADLIEAQAAYAARTGRHGREHEHRALARGVRQRAERDARCERELSL